jgi:TRAP-type C4-dicarboxylate transport system substrate-binding protein
MIIIKERVIDPEIIIVAKERKMIKRLCVSLVLVFVVAGMVFAGGGRDAARPVVVRLGGIQPAEDIASQGMEMMARIAAEKSGGTLEIQVFPASQLGNATAQIEAVSIGSQEMFIDASGFVGTFLRDRQIDAMFFLFRDAAHYRAFMASDLNKGLEEDFLRLKGIRLLGHNWFRAPRSFVSRTPFDANTVQGLRVRVPDIRGYLESVSAIGGSPTQIAWGETYLALQQGVVDAAEGPADSLFSMRFYEAARYVMVTNHIRDSLQLMINDRIWSRLSPEHQRILVEAGNEAGDWYSNQVNTTVENAFRAIREGGGIITEVDVAPLRDRVARRIQEIEAEGNLWRRGLYQEIQNIR